MVGPDLGKFEKYVPLDALKSLRYIPIGFNGSVITSKVNGRKLVKLIIV